MTVSGKTWWALAGAANLAVAASLLLRAPVKPAERVARASASPDVTPKSYQRGVPRTAPQPPATAPQPSASAVGGALPAAAHSAGPALASSSEPPAARVAWSPTPVVITTAPLLAAPPPPAPAEPARLTVKPRRVSLAPLASWSKPGLCSTSEEAQATRDKLTERFRQVEAGAQGRLFLDPRLPEEADKQMLELLSQAQLVTKQALGLEPPPPQVFVYFDQRLMKAAACINDDVAAFYDGALHVALGRPDLQQSVTHEFAHHALFSSGLVGPAWAQEGIAMNLAGETWWRDRSRLQALLQTPFSAEQMDELIPYKLPTEQAVDFYVQAALTVQCLQRMRSWSLQQLADTLRAGSSNAESISYDLPELSQSSFLSSCAAQLPANVR